MSLTVSLVAVLIPLLFMGGIVGRLFREFAVTLSVDHPVSAVVSLTLTADDVRPAPAPRADREQQGRFYRVTERVVRRTHRGYGASLCWVFS